VCLARAALVTEADFDVAERAAANARRLAPDEADVHYVSGRVSFAREQWSAAQGHPQQALALNPAHSGALNELGRISLKKRDASRAADHFIQAARTAPDQPAHPKRSHSNPRDANQEQPRAADGTGPATALATHGRLI
jgi:cytochrome c-type biogenesis protein CcmH/NrfG